MVEFIIKSRVYFLKVEHKFKKQNILNPIKFMVQVTDFTS